MVVCLPHRLARCQLPSPWTDWSEDGSPAPSAPTPDRQLCERCRRLAQCPDELQTWKEFGPGETQGLDQHRGQESEAEEDDGEAEYHPVQGSGRRWLGLSVCWAWYAVNWFYFMWTWLYSAFTLALLIEYVSDLLVARIHVCSFFLLSPLTDSSYYSAIPPLRIHRHTTRFSSIQLFRFSSVVNMYVVTQ